MFLLSHSAIFAVFSSAKRKWVLGVVMLIMGVSSLYAQSWTAPPTLPVFGSSDFNVTISNPSIDGGATVSTNNTPSINASVIDAFINYCSTNQTGGLGGTVEVPAGIYSLNPIILNSNVNLQIDPGCVLSNAVYTNTLITSSGKTNMEISGGGVIEGGAMTAPGGNKLVYLQGVNTLEVTNVSVEDSGNEHLVVENDINVTISGVTIADPGTLKANNGNYLANTDGIDFYGTNFLIKNCSVNDGDDNICAKPASGGCANIVITNCAIGVGHGISIGGGTSHGLSNMLVTDCSFNGTVNGLRIKACDSSWSNSLVQDYGGGLANPVTNVTYRNITMTNVTNPIILESFYNGNDNLPTNKVTSPTNLSYYPSIPTVVNSTTPMYEGISFDNIQITNAGNAGIFEGLNTTTPNINGLSFSNVTISASQEMVMWYATNVSIIGVSVTIPQDNPYANASPIAGSWTYDASVTIVPEPSTPVLCLLGLAGALLCWRFGWYRGADVCKRSDQRQ